MYFIDYIEIILVLLFYKVYHLNKEDKEKRS